MMASRARRHPFTTPSPPTRSRVYGSATAPVLPQDVPVEINCAEGEVPVNMTSTPPGHTTPFTVTVVAIIRMLTAPHASFVIATLPVSVKPDAEIVVIRTLSSNWHAVTVAVSASAPLPDPFAAFVPWSVPWYAP